MYQKKVYSWKIFTKCASGQNLRKLSVSLGSLTSFGTSSTKIFLKSIFCDVENALLYGNLVHVETSKRCPKTGFFAALLIQTRLFCREYGPLGISLRILYFNLCKHLKMHVVN